MSVWPMLLHRMALISCRLYGIFWANSLPPPPWQKISRTPMTTLVVLADWVILLNGISGPPSMA